MEPLISQTTPPSTELPSIQPIPTSSFLKTKLPWIINIILLLIIISGGYFFLSIKNQTSSKTPLSISPTPPNQRMNKTPTIIPTQNPTPLLTITQNWKTEIIDLYGLSLSLPVDWTIQEVNRRPEPKGPPHPITGHDCAEYLITDSRQYLKLYLLPTCGFSDSGASAWPNDAVIIKQLENNNSIIRFYNSSVDSYFYAQGGSALVSDEKGTRQEKNHGSALFYGQNPLTIIIVKLQYFGPQELKDQYLAQTDKIISSIKNF